MPKIPSYQTQVGVSNLPTVRMDENAPLEAFGGGQARADLGAATQGLIKQQIEFVQKEKQAADETFAMKISKLGQERLTKDLYGPDGAMLKRGEHAFGLNESYGKGFDEYMKGLQETASNDNQRYMIQAISTKLGGALNETLQKHTANETVNFQRDVSKSAIQASQEMAVAFAHDPLRRGEALGQMRAAAYKALEIEGVTGPRADFKVAEQMSQGHLATLDRLSNVDPGAAEQLYKELISTNQLLSKDGERAWDTIKGSVTRAESQRATDEIVSRGGSLSAQLKAADEMFANDVEKRDETKQRIKQAASDRKMAEEESDQRQYEAAYSILTKSKNLDDIPVALLRSLKPEKQENLKNIARRMNSGENASPNSSEAYNLRKMMALEPNKFKKLNLREYTTFITDGEMTKFQETQVDMLAGKKNPDEDSVRKLNTIINQRLNSLGIDPSPKPGTAAAKDVESFWSQVQTEMDEYEAETGKRTTPEQKQMIVDKLSIEIPKSGSWFNSKAPTFKVNFSDISDKHKAAITAFLKKNNRPATERNIVDYYRRTMIKAKD